MAVGGIVSIAVLLDVSGAAPPPVAFLAALAVVYALFRFRLAALERGRLARPAWLFDDSAEDPEDPDDAPQPISALGWGQLPVALVMTAVILGAAYAAIVWAPDEIAPRPASAQPTAQSIAAERNSVRTAALGTLAALGASLGLLMTFQSHRQSAAEARALERDRSRNAKRARRTFVAERFNDAIKQLAEGKPGGEEGMAVRIAGVYSLSNIRREDQLQTPAVRDVLTAFVAPYLREQQQLDADAEDDALDNLDPNDPADVAIAETLFERPGAPADHAAAMVVLARIFGRDPVSDGRRALPFWAAELPGADLRGAHLRGARLRGANLAGADLRGANLITADLREAVLLGADFRGAQLAGARLHGVVAELADFRGADLVGAEFKGANLRRAEFEDARVAPGWNDDAWRTKVATEPTVVPPLVLPRVSISDRDPPAHA